MALSYIEMLRLAEDEEFEAKQHRHHKDIEHKIQVSCVRWFRYQHPDLPLFAIPNGGRRDKTTAAKLKAEGVVAGVADLFLAVPRKTYHGLFVEMKTEERNSRQRDSQKAFQQQVEQQGYHYVIARNIDDFITIITDYLS